MKQENSEGNKDDEKNTPNEEESISEDENPLDVGEKEHAEMTNEDA